MTEFNTFGLVLLKGHADKLSALNEAVKDVSAKHAKQGLKPEVLFGLACAGYFDCILLINSNTIEEIGKFVIEDLRKDYPDMIADTQTFVCWKIN